MATDLADGFRNGSQSYGSFLSLLLGDGSLREQELLLLDILIYKARNRK
jgi:hypothetical protein